MCTRYVSPEAAAIERVWHVGRGHPWRGAEVFPRAQGAFIRSKRNSSAAERELVVGPWGLIPWFSKTAKLSYSTQNARSEDVTAKASYKQPWSRGQRCIIPAWTFDEPNWETGRNVWWRFGRSDLQPWGLAGLWATWTDPATGEIHESYTMLTVNADACPLMRRMHKPDAKLPRDAQDKRAVVPIEPELSDLWLHGTVKDAAALIRYAPLERYLAGPATDPLKPVDAEGTISPS